MKSFFIIFFLFFTFSSIAQDDIEEFQIEGFVIGESLLDHYSEKQIKKLKKNNSLSDDMIYAQFFISDSNGQKFDIYESLTLSVNDQYKIIGISGDIRIKINKCMKLHKEISNDILRIFPNSNKMGEQWMENQELGKVYFTSVEFDNGYAAVMCKKDYDTLSVIVVKDLL